MMLSLKIIEKKITWQKMVMKEKESAAQTATAIEREIGKIMAAESKGVPKLKPRPRPSGNSKGGLIDYRKTGLFK